MKEFEEFDDGSALSLIALAVDETLRAEGIDSEKAREIARGVALAVAHEFGGQYWYIPMFGTRTADPPLIAFAAARLEQALKNCVNDRGDLAMRCAQACRKRIGGDYLYVSRGSSAKRRSRDQQIWHEFTGTNYRELSNRFELSEMRVRQIIQKQRERRAQFRGK